MRRILPHPSRSSGSPSRRGTRGRPARSGDDRETRCAIASMPSARELREKALRMADAGDRVHAPRAMRERRRAARIAQVAPTRLEPRRRRARIANAPARGRAPRRRGVGDQRTTASTSSRRDAGSRSGPAGSSQPLPRPRARVDHGDLDVARQRVVLQAVVGDDHVARADAPRASARAAATRSRADHTGKPGAREQQRLVADHGADRRPAIDRARRRRRVAAVAAADDARMPAALRERVGERERRAASCPCRRR